ncbi:hypothetical protein [Kineosporia corallincola]|nr:hypothetical protein [Kineosporia corallincola]
MSERTDEIIREGAALAIAANQMADELEVSLLELLRVHLQGETDD